MPHDVFISHSAQDKSVATAICTTLESAGMKCWIAPRNIVGGRYSIAIIKAIKACRIVVLVLSSNANKSQHVIREIERAVSRGKEIYPFRVEEVGPSEELELFISSEQWLDAFTPPLEDHLRQLAANVKAQLQLMDNSSAQLTQPRTTIPKGLRINRKRILQAVIGIVVILGGIVGFWKWKNLPSPGPITEDIKWLDGEWTGTALQMSAEETGARATWTVVLTAQEDRYNIEYPTLGCNGVLNLISKEPARARFNENILIGSRCVDNGIVIVEKINDAQISFKYSAPDETLVTSSGTLNKKE